MKDGNVKITVVGSGELSADEAIKTESLGKLYTKKEARYLLYEVPEVDNKNIVMRYLLKFYDNTLEMSKSCPSDPSVRSKIIYKPNTKSETNYSTPYGILNLTFHTDYYSISETDNKIAFSLRYKILMGDDILSRNRLEILVTEA